MWRMLQHSEPGDFVVATGEAYSVRQFLEEAFGYAGLDWQKHVEIDPQYFRPTEVDYLLGDSSKARSAFNWQPNTTFKQLVRMMVDSDTRMAEEERVVSRYQPSSTSRRKD
jgi:GDPmannose 4,6-dehydratase